MWTALNKEVQQSDEWKAHRAARQAALDNGIKHSRAQASSPAAAPSKYEDYGNETSQVIPALSRKSNAQVRQQRVHADHTSAATTPNLALKILAPRTLRLQNKADVEASRNLSSLSIKPKQKEKPEGQASLGTAYATTEATARRLSSMAERSVGHSKTADHPAQEPSIDMACVDRPVFQAPLFNFKGGPDGDPDAGDN